MSGPGGATRAVALTAQPSIGISVFRLADGRFFESVEHRWGVRAGTQHFFLLFPSGPHSSLEWLHLFGVLRMELD